MVTHFTILSVDVFYFITSLCCVRAWICPSVCVSSTTTSNTRSVTALTSPFLQVSVESFERTNLTMKVFPMPKPPAKLKSRSKPALDQATPPSFKSFRLAFAGLVENRLQHGKQAPTLIYANTTKRVDEIVEWINGKLPLVRNNGMPVAGAYHAGDSLTDEDRRSAHRAFMRDDHEIMVATMAYGECCVG